MNKSLWNIREVQTRSVSEYGTHLASLHCSISSLSDILNTHVSSKPPAGHHSLPTGARLLHAASRSSPSRGAQKKKVYKNSLHFSKRCELFHSNTGKLAKDCMLKKTHIVASPFAHPRELTSKKKKGRGLGRDKCLETSLLNGVMS
ncbi:hypothetical protein E2C01_059988 [Portunus trituberculatus]|uniref:Uncharacterized protein n=1 Tax=Portunus trituberculatus TaxID=210409 RepID=A0A5B7H433_PORTR|nr:hypothetical protein [Portunus trituberculatus]